MTAAVVVAASAVAAAVQCPLPRRHLVEQVVMAMQMLLTLLRQCRETGRETPSSSIQVRVCVRVWWWRRVDSFRIQHSAHPSVSSCVFPRHEADCRDVAFHWLRACVLQVTSCRSSSCDTTQRGEVLALIQAAS